MSNLPGYTCPLCKRSDCGTVNGTNCQLYQFAECRRQLDEAHDDLIEYAAAVEAELAEARKSASLARGDAARLRAARDMLERYQFANDGHCVCCGSGKTEHDCELTRALAPAPNPPHLPSSPRAGAEPGVPDAANVAALGHAAVGRTEGSNPSTGAAPPQPPLPQGVETGDTSVTREWTGEEWRTIDPTVGPYGHRTDESAGIVRGWSTEFQKLHEVPSPPQTTAAGLDPGTVLDGFIKLYDYTWTRDWCRDVLGVDCYDSQQLQAELIRRARLALASSREGVK